MKNTFSLAILLCVAFFISCQSGTKKLGDFKLLPLPQEFKINGVSQLEFKDVNFYAASTDLQLPVRGAMLDHLKVADKTQKAQILIEIDISMDLKAEGYKMTISENEITIIAKDNAGLLYALTTLEQLMEDAKEQNVNLPLCSIVDFPELSYRAIQLDLKHHREKTSYYYALMDRLKKYKINGIIAEVEDKLKYVRQPKIGSADALSIEEWKKLCTYAKERNIEISPLVQGLGHSSFILKHNEYTDLRDDPNSDWAFNPLDPRTYEVQFDLYLDAIEATPYGKYLHVGGDEVHTSGRGSGKSSLELQLLWLNKVCEFAEEQGRIPIFWDDMPLKYAGVYDPMFNTKMTKEEVEEVWDKNEHKLVDFLDLFPKNCIYMRWNYSSSEAYGNQKAMEWFRKNGMQVMGATAGQTRWVLMPQQESNIDNIRSFAVSSINSDLNGLLLTLWDDDSPHFELYMRGIISFAEYTWSGEKRTKSEIKEAYRQREFSHELSGNEFAFIDNLEEPVSFWKNALLKGNKRNYLKKMENPLKAGVIDFPDKNDKGKWVIKYSERIEQAKLLLIRGDSIEINIQKMKSKAIRNNYTLEIYEKVNQLSQFAPKALLALEAYDLASTKEEELEAIERIHQLPEEFMELKTEMEKVYGRTRILIKPKDYILDQDHHVHLANQSISFDWQFNAEILFMEKIKNSNFKVEINQVRP